ncbi:MAG: polysaccharide biosynthesis C-terminal domain-containing protein, partial [Ruminococcus sp.]|nr:polysaccharide biosynthesis C-terminal domain-containing protein [Ruminococcus sp.]
TVMWTFTGFSDQIFIGNMCSENSAGIYSASAKIPNLLSMLSTIFFQAWNISAITENDSEDRNEFYSKIYSSYESVLFIGSAGLIFLIKPISAILINYNTFPEYSKAYLYAPVLITASVFTCLDQFLSGIYSATKHTLNSLVTVAVACIANIILNTHLIPVWEINGASTATFLSYFICFCIRIADSRRYIPFKFSMLKNILNTLLILIMCRFTYEQSGIIPTAIITVMVVVLNIRAVYETFRMIFPHR